jgi:hypothetical protein
MADLDIGSILSSLSSEDINNLKNMANSILGGNNSNTETNKPPEENKTQNQGSAPFPDLSALGLPDMSQFSALLPLLSAFNTHDDREDFIYALKPLLSKERQRKADESIKFIKLLSIIPLLKEKGLM